MTAEFTLGSYTTILNLELDLSRKNTLHYPAPPASKEGLLSKAESHPHSLFEKDYGILGGPVELRDKAL